MEDHSTQLKKIELNDGTHMPLLGFGTWKGEGVSADMCQRAAEAAIAAGYRHIDTAHSYKNETELGRAIHAKIQQGIIRRQDLFIVSKLWCTHHAPGDIPLCLNSSLHDLQLEYLDLYLVHFPVGLKMTVERQMVQTAALTPSFCGNVWYLTEKTGDELFPAENGQILTTDTDYVEVWKGMEALKATGKVKSIGVSNFSIQQLERLLSVAKIPPAVNQVELHPYLVQSDLIDFCKSKNIALTAYSPFGSPGRPSKLHRGDTDPHKLLEDPVIVGVAKKHRRTAAQVLLRYHIEQGIAAIPKSTKSHHILENTKIFDFTLDEEDMKALRSLNRGWKACIIPELESHPFYPFK